MILSQAKLCEKHFQMLNIEWHSYVLMQIFLKVIIIGSN